MQLVAIVDLHGHRYAADSSRNVQPERRLHDVRAGSSLQGISFNMIQINYFFQIPALEDKNSSTYRWGLSEALMTDVLFPRAIGLNVTLPYSFSMCSRYDLSDERIDALRRMNLDDAIRSVRSERPPIVKCEYYTFRNEVVNFILRPS